MPKKIFNIVIIGSGDECWAAALLLAKKLKISGQKIAVIELGKNKKLKKIVAAGPSIRRFHQLIGVSEKELIRQSIAIPSLGVELSSVESGRHFFHAYKHEDTDSSSLDWPIVAAMSAQMNDDQDELCLAAAMARAERFIDPERVSNEDYQSLAVGWHLQLSTYTQFLKNLALEQGVILYEALWVNSCCSDTGIGIEKVQLDQQREVFANLFVDFTASGLVEKNHRADCNFEFLYRYHEGAIGNGKKNSELLVWSRSAFLMNYMPAVASLEFYGFECSDNREIDNDFNNFASNIFKNYCASNNLDQQYVKFNVYDDASWSDNCIRIPPASSFPWDLICGYGELTRRSMQRLLGCYADLSSISVMAEEFNYYSALEADKYKQFALIYLYLTEGVSKARLQELFDPRVVNEVEHSISLFRSTAVISTCLSDLLTREQWISFFIGFGVVPISGGMVLDLIPSQKILLLLAQRKDQVKKACDKAPLIGQYISYYLAHDRFL